MNQIYRVVWNVAKGIWQVVSEFGSGRTKSSTSRANKRKQAVVLALVATSSVGFAANPLPAGGTVVAGQATISNTGQTMIIHQSSTKAVIDWTNFSIAKGNTVNFVQPSAMAVALNRVLGTDPSVIQGALNANGHVFLINPNGVLFGPTAQVNVGGLLASTLSMSTADFMAGRYHLSGASASAVENQGSLQAGSGGNIALVAAKVTNAGQINADKGNVLLGAGSDVLVDFGGPVKLQIQRGALDALVDNGGAIHADGGTVLLTAKSASELTGSAINNSGIIQARTLASGEQGHILLLGDMQSGTLRAGGTLDASAPVAGNGGNIETSASHVENDASLVVNAGAAKGTGGHWLIDPYDYTINAAAATTITNSLNQGTSVTVTTQSSNTGYGGAASSGSGDITVSSAIAKTAGGNASLTLKADRNIVVNSDITSTSGMLNLTLSSANAGSATVGGIDINANLKSNGGSILIGGANGSAASGIGYALNLNNTAAAITIEQAKSILSSGGNITINGRSLVGSSSGNYSGSTAGVYIKSNATIQSGTGNLLVNGESDGGSHTFGLAFEGNSNTVTTLGSSTGGGTMLLNAVNATAGATAADQNAGAIGLVSYGNRARIVFNGPSVADWLVYVNGAPQLSAYTQAPQLSSCASPYPNCGTMVVPGSNNSYLYATYQAVDMATLPVYVIQSGSGSKVYDGTTTATGLSYTTLGGPAGFAASNLNPNPVYYTTSKNVGTYNTLVPSAVNPTDYTAGGTTYAVGYFNTGSYTITQKALTPSAANKVYDGSTTAAVSVSGVIGGDAVTASGNGSFASKDVGTYSVSISNIVLGGADAGNYTLSGNAASATASITPRTVTVSATKSYDGSASLSNVAIGNLVAGEDLSAIGATANSANVTSASYINAISLANGIAGLASNYQLPVLTSASASNSAHITPKALTVGGLSASDKVYDGTAVANLSGGTLSGMVAGETLGLSALTGSFADKNVGTGKTVSLSTVSLSDGTGLASNYTVAQPLGLTANITPKSLAVSGLTASDKVYDGNTAAVVSTSNAGLQGLVVGDNVTIAATGAFNDANAGAGKTVTLNVSAGGTDASNYSISGQSNATASITPKALTLTGLSAANKVYDGSTTASLTGGALAGLVGSETLGLAAITGAFLDKNAGSAKTVSLSGGALADGTGLASNYTLALPSNLIASIAPKSLTVSGITASGKVYDGATTATVSVANASLQGLVAGDNVSVAATGQFLDKNVGNAKTVSLTSTVNGVDASNYTVQGQASTTASITPKALTVSGINAADKAYDGTTIASVSTAGAHLQGLVSGDQVSVSASGSFADANAANGKTVALASSYSGADAGNYTITGQASTTASITPKALTLAGLSAADKVYDGSTTATLSGGTLLGLVSNETLNLGGFSGSFADKNAGANKTVTISGQLTDGTGLASNYILAQPSHLTATITPKALTVSGITASDKIYDGATAATVSVASASLHGLIAGDNVSLAATGQFLDKNVGNAKTVSLSSTVNGADAFNYTVQGQASTTASITPKALTVSGITAADKVYDGTTSATVTSANVSLQGLVAGDNVSVAASGAFLDQNVGTGKSVALASTYGGSDAGNYTIAGQASTTASITPKALTIVGMTASNKVYDGTTTAALSGGTLSGLVGGESVGLAGASGAFADKNVGSSKAVTVSGVALTNGTGLASNYSVAQPSGLTADITPKALTVSGITATGKTYDGTTAATVSAANANLQGLVAGDNVAVAASGAFLDKNAGVGKTVALTSVYSGTDAANYTIQGQASTTATITPKALTINGLSVAGKVYDGSTTAVLSGGTLTGLIGNETLSLGGLHGTFADKNAGANKAVSVSGQLADGTGLASNYALAQSAALSGTITPKALTVTGITAANKTYDGGTTASVSTANASLQGLVAGDSVTIAASGSFADKNAGTAKTVSLRSAYSGADVGNYTIQSQGTTTASITPKTLTVSGITAANKTYDGSTSANVSTAAASLQGLVAGDSVTVSASGTFADKNAGAGKTVNLTSAYGGADVANYAIQGQATSTASITPKALTVSGITALDKVYDGNTGASVSSANATLQGLVAGDSVTVGASGVFLDKNAGNAKTVSLSSTVGGADAANYVISGQASTTANITPRALTVTGITALDKTYDGTTTATVSISGARLQGLVDGDSVSVSANGSFADKNAGSGKQVNLVEAVNGADAGNYALTAQSGAIASIAPKVVSVTGATVADKTADGSTGATLTSAGRLVGALTNDSVALNGSAATAQFSQTSPGNGIAVNIGGLALSGSDAGNYAFGGTATATGTIRSAAPAAPAAWVAAATIAPQNQGIASVLQAPAVGGMAYLAVPDQVAANGGAVAAIAVSSANPQAANGAEGQGGEAGSSVSASERRQSSSQAAGNGRDVKFLNVLVVAGGIRMPDGGSNNGQPEAHAPEK